MQPVLQLISRVGPSDANILITGEPEPERKWSRKRFTRSRSRIEAAW